MSPSKDPDENQILKEEDTQIYTHLESLFMHMIDDRDSQILNQEMTMSEIKENLLNI